jgi:hypothetical protein
MVEKAVQATLGMPAKRVVGMGVAIMRAKMGDLAMRYLAPELMAIQAVTAKTEARGMLVKMAVQAMGKEAMIVKAKPVKMAMKCLAPELKAIQAKLGVRVILGMQEWPEIQVVVAVARL